LPFTLSPAATSVAAAAAAAAADPTREIAVAYGMIDPELKDAEGLPLTCRSVFIVGPDKKLKLSLK
jgi:alkyl hydroperoxide reductase subunit AhpC